MNRFLIKFRSFVFLLALLVPAFSFTQNTRNIANWLESYRISGNFPAFQLLSAAQDRSDLPMVADHLTQFRLDASQLAKLQKAAPTTLSLQIPQTNNSPVVLELAQVDILGPDFKIGTLGDQAQNSVPVERGLHYRGIMQGIPGSIATLSIFSDGIVAMYTDDTGTYQVGKMEDGTDQYVLYRSEDLHEQAPHTCFNDESMENLQGTPGVDDRGVGCKTVQVYFECDYKLFQDRGATVANVNAYVTSLFNQVAALYANENIGIAISEIYVWTSTDPYAGLGSTSAVLNAFRSNKGTNFNGNLAHFLSTRNLGGGIAYVDAICLKQYAFGVSAITNTFQNVPTYSWSVEVVTHELGHNLGSWHTHSCQWPNGALDNCVSPEGSCSPGPAPVNGGTIMSYCHLTSYGINFNNGFGSVPGNLIRSKVLAATCLTQSGSTPGSLAANNITANSATLSWGAIAGATNYTVQYKTSSTSTWTSAGSTAATILTLNGLLANTGYEWQVKTDCSAFSATATFTTTNSGGGNGACSIPVSLSSSNLTSSSAILSWAAVSGAANYTVQYKPNTSSTWITAGNASTSSYNLSGLSATTLYNWRVKANCSDYSASANFTTLSNGGGGACNTPVGLTSTNVTSTSASLSWSAVQGSTSYSIQYKLSTSSTWLNAGTVVSTNLTITGLLASTSYNWQVKANCSAYSATASFTTTGGGNGNCSAPGNLTNVNVTATQAILSWTPVSGATNYTLQLRYANSSTYYTLGTVSCTQVSLSGLQPSTSYAWRVKANCSDYSPALPLNTPAGFQQGPTSASLSDGSISITAVEQIELKVYPNPVSRLLNVNWDGIKTEETRIWVNDMSGRRWLDQNYSNVLDLASLPAGMYVVILLEGTERVAVEQFIKL
jgi:hypothetical protein